MKSIKTHVGTIVTSVIAGTILLFIQFNTDWFTTKDHDPSEMKELLIERITDYYKDLTEKDFDAKDYFAARVERFFQLKNTNPQAINYSYNKFYKEEFLNIKCHPDFRDLTLIKEGDIYVAEFVLNCSFYLKSKGKTKIGSYMERVKFRKDGQFVYFHDYKILKEAWQ